MKRLACLIFGHRLMWVIDRLDLSDTHISIGGPEPGLHGGRITAKHQQCRRCGENLVDWDSP